MPLMARSHLVALTPVLFTALIAECVTAGEDHGYAVGPAIGLKADRTVKPTGLGRWPFHSKPLPCDSNN